MHFVGQRGEEMRFKDYYLSRLIGGVTQKRFATILEDEDLDITARNLGTGSIYLSNHKVVKCVCNYYKRTDNKAFPKISSNNAFLRCQAVRDNFNLRHVSKMECKYCHRTCLLKVENGEMARK